MSEAEIIFMPVPKQLTPEQKEYWEYRLEDAERAVEVALRMLGRLPIENGLERLPSGAEQTNPSA